MEEYVVDAFTDKVFSGNPAAVCFMDAWLPEELIGDQASRRGGVVYGKLAGDRVTLSGKAALYSEAEIHIEQA